VTVDLFLKTISIGGTALLAFMGAYLAVVPIEKKSHHKTWWVGGFAAGGILTAWAGILLSDRADNALKEMLTGGDHYCYYRAEIVSPDDLTSKSPLWVICDGPLYNLNVWFSPADSGGANDPRYWSMSGSQHYGEIIPGGFRAGMALGPGKYRIEMSARNGTVVEILEIKPIDGKLTQSLQVYVPPNGKMLHSE
jgi:hypothetical protein